MKRTPSNKDNSSSSEEISGGIKRAIVLVLAIAGQAPSAITAIGVYPISLYHPGIYHGLEPFLLIPLMIAVIATWAVLQWRLSMAGIFVLFIVLAVFVLYVYQTYPPSNSIHQINWILSYCAVALFMAAFSRFVTDFLA
jgi:hypothetical protein